MINDHRSMYFCTHFVSNSTSWQLLFFSMTVFFSPLHFTFLSPVFHSRRTYTQTSNKFISKISLLVLTKNTWKDKITMHKQVEENRLSGKILLKDEERKTQSDWHSSQAQVVQRWGKNRIWKRERIRVLCDVRACFENATVSPEKSTETRDERIFLWCSSGSTWWLKCVRIVARTMKSFRSTEKYSPQKLKRDETKRKEIKM